MEIGEILKSLDVKQLELWMDDGGVVPEDALMKAVEAIPERKVEKGKPANSIPVEERKQLADVVRILLRKEVNVDSKTEMGNTVLIQAARRGHMETVQLLVEKGATVSEEGSRGWTALGTAAWFGYTSIVDYLMKHGAKTDESTIDGNTVLHLAVNEGKTETAKFLVENGANLFGQNKQKRTEVHRTIEEGHTELFEWLKSRGALKDKDDKGRNQLHLAAQSARTDTSEKLVKLGSHLDAEDDEGRTALHLAAEGGHTETLKKLIDLGANVDAKDKDGKTAMHLSAEVGHTDIVRALYTRGADLEIKAGWYEASPLHYAAMRGKDDVALELALLGAQLDSKEGTEVGGGRGRTPLDVTTHAKTKQELEEIKEFINNGKKAHKTETSLRLELALRTNRIDTVKAMISIMLRNNETKNLEDVFLFACEKAEGKLFHIMFNLLSEEEQLHLFTPYDGYSIPSKRKNGKSFLQIFAEHGDALSKEREDMIRMYKDNLKLSRDEIVKILKQSLVSSKFLKTWIESVNSKFPISTAIMAVQILIAFFSLITVLFFLNLDMWTDVRVDLDFHHYAYNYQNISLCKDEVSKKESNNFPDYNWDNLTPGDFHSKFNQFVKKINKIDDQISECWDNEMTRYSTEVWFKFYILATAHIVAPWLFFILIGILIVRRRMKHKIKIVEDGEKMKLMNLTEKSVEAESTENLKGSKRRILLSIWQFIRHSFKILLFPFSVSFKSFWLKVQIAQEMAKFDNSSTTNEKEVLQMQNSNALQTAFRIENKISKQKSEIGKEEKKNRMNQIHEALHEIEHQMVLKGMLEVCFESSYQFYLQSLLALPILYTQLIDSGSFFANIWKFEASKMFSILSSFIAISFSFYVIRNNNKKNALGPKCTILLLARTTSEMIVRVFLSGLFLYIVVPGPNGQLDPIMVTILYYSHSLLLLVFNFIFNLDAPKFATHYLLGLIFNSLSSNYSYNFIDYNMLLWGKRWQTRAYHQSSFFRQGLFYVIFLFENTALTIAVLLTWREGQLVESGNGGTFLLLWDDLRNIICVLWALQVLAFFLMFLYYATHPSSPSLTSLEEKGVIYIFGTKYSIFNKKTI